jgi:hypothetical protein
MPPNILPSPSDFSAGHFAGWFFTLYASLLVVSIAVIWALWTGFKNHNWLPSMRQRMLDDEAGRRAATDAPARREPARTS